MIHRTLALALIAASVAHSQEAEPPLWTKCGTEIEWMTDRRPQTDNNQGGGLARTKVDLDDLWGDVKAKAKETGRPILWYIPKVEGSHMYREVILDHYMNVSIWTDEAVVELVKSRFVPMRAACAKELKSETGVERWRVVEPAIVIFDADGKELHFIQRIRTFNADFIGATLRAVLKKHSTQAPPADASGRDLMNGGWFDAAAAKLADDPLTLAELRRREGKFDEAHKLCDSALRKGAASDQVATVRGRTLLSEGKIAEAKAALVKASTPEGAYFLAHAERLSGNDEGARAIWARLAESSPRTRWGWRSAANTTLHQDQKSYGPAALGFEDVLWSGAAAEGATTTRWERKPEDVQDVAKRAVAWLLRAQSADGAWNDSRYAYWPSPEIQPNVHMAVTGLALSALLEWRDLDPARIDEAIARGEKYLLDDSKMARGKNEESYADTYRLLYLSLKRGTLRDDAAAAKVVDRMNSIVKTIAAIQDKGGSWSHEYPNPFVSATVLQTLTRARNAGATVDDAVMSRGAAALISTRDDQGRQGYAAGRKGASDSDSSGRNAMCEAALLENKATTQESFEKAMDQFWKHLDRREVVRVCDFHSDGQLAGFFFFNNFYHTMEAVSHLKGPAADDARAKGAAHLTKIPEIDGSFIDSHEMGKSYGTAAALLSLKRCLEK